MIGSDLTTGQKIQIGFVLLVLIVAGFLIFRGSTPPPSDSVNSWTELRHYAKDPGKPVGLQNPWDPVKEELISVFACSDGKLLISEFKNDPNRHPSFRFSPDNRRTTFIYYHDPIAPAKAFKDPYRRALALAAYNTVYGSMLGFLGTVGLTADQIAKEAAARKIMNNSVAVVRAGIEQGTLHPELLDQVMNAVAAYKAKAGDPQRDDAKADLARKVLHVACQYIQRTEADQNVAIEKYIDTVDDLLTSVQKERLAATGKQYEATLAAQKGVGVKAVIPPRPPTATRPTVPAAARGTPPSRGTPPANRGPSTPTRGGG